MKNITRTRIITSLTGLLAALTLAACAVTETPVVPAITAGATVPAASIASGTPASRAITGGETVDPITSYDVVFYKVEIGNSETDKFTLWENASGETKDITGAVAFDNVQAVVPGTYQFVRLTIGSVLTVAGSVTDPADSSVYSGTGTCQLTETVYLWGASLPGSSGETTLQAPVTIDASSTLHFGFQIAGTVTYQSGSASAAILGVTKPVMTLTSE